MPQALGTVPLFRSQAQFDYCKLLACLILEDEEEDAAETENEEEDWD